jgi:hypothetical protein
VTDVSVLRFLFASMTSGSYELEVDDGVNAPLSRAVHVTDGLARETFVLDRGRVIRGRVVDANGQPQRDVWVTARCAIDGAPEADMETGDLAVRVLREARRVVSDGTGSFTLADVSRAATSCTVRAEEPGGSFGEKQQVTPGEDVVVKMSALGALSGTVHAVDGREVREFVVSVTPAGEQRQSRAEAVTSADGSWKLAHVPPGTLQIKAQTVQGEIATETVELAPGQSLDGVQLRLAAAQNVTETLAN